MLGRNRNTGYCASSSSGRRTRNAFFNLTIAHVRKSCKLSFYLFFTKQNIHILLLWAMLSRIMFCIFHSLYVCCESKSIVGAIELDIREIWCPKISKHVHVHHSVIYYMFDSFFTYIIWFSKKMNRIFTLLSNTHSTHTHTHTHTWFVFLSSFDVNGFTAPFLLFPCVRKWKIEVQFFLLKTFFWYFRLVYRQPSRTWK